MDKQTLPNILRLCHIRIGDGAGRAEGLLHRMGADPADHVQHSASLVVGAGSPGTAERLQRGIMKQWYADFSENLPHGVRGFIWEEMPGSRGYCLLTIWAMQN